jgi:hypothetical protein
LASIFDLRDFILLHREPSETNRSTSGQLKTRENRAFGIVAAIERCVQLCERQDALPIALPSTAFEAFHNPEEIRPEGNCVPWIRAVPRTRHATRSTIHALFAQVGMQAASVQGPATPRHATPRGALRASPV